MNTVYLIVAELAGSFSDAPDETVIAEAWSSREKAERRMEALDGEAKLIGDMDIAVRAATDADPAYVAAQCAYDLVKAQQNGDLLEALRTHARAHAEAQKRAIEEVAQMSVADWYEWSQAAPCGIGWSRKIVEVSVLG